MIVLLYKFVVSYVMIRASCGVPSSTILAYKHLHFFRNLLSHNHFFSTSCIWSLHELSLWNRSFNCKRISIINTISFICEDFLSLYFLISHRSTIITNRPLVLFILIRSSPRWVTLLLCIDNFFTNELFMKSSSFYFYQINVHIFFIFNEFTTLSLALGWLGILLLFDVTLDCV